MDSLIRDIVYDLYRDCWYPGAPSRDFPITVCGDFGAYGVAGMADRWWQQGWFESLAHALAYADVLYAGIQERHPRWCAWHPQWCAEASRG